MKPTEIMKLSPEEREKLLRESMKAAEKEMFEVCEANELYEPIEVWKVTIHDDDKDDMLDSTFFIHKHNIFPWLSAKFGLDSVEEFKDICVIGTKTKCYSGIGELERLSVYITPMQLWEIFEDAEKGD